MGSADPTRSSGFFLEPTTTNVKPAMEIWHEQVHGSAAYPVTSSEEAMPMEIDVDQDYLHNTLVDLVGINSINPSLIPTGAGEAEIAAYVVDVLQELKLEVATHEPEPGRPSVVGTLKGSGGGRSLMLNAHVDTVGVDDMLDPFSATIRDGKLYGRGAYDMKGSVAACMTAVKGLIEAGATLAGDVMIAAVADEEVRQPWHIRGDQALPY